MIEESLLKSNFIGRDGFRWWVGQVAPFEDGTGQGEQNNGGGWGNRAKVRILGYHPFDEGQLSNEDLPWAQVLLPTTAGSGAGNIATNTKLRPSDYVFGFFLDGDNAQIPVIIGVFGRSSEVSQETYNPLTTPPFVPFTGYTGRIERPNGTLAPDESNEQNSQAQKSPRDVPVSAISDLNSQVSAINARNISGVGAGQSTSVPLKPEIPYYTAIGQKVTLANTCKDTAVSSIISQVNTLFDRVTGVQSAFINIDLELERAATSIQVLSNAIVASMFRNLTEQMIPTLQSGLFGLYNRTVASYPPENENQGILAGTNAQRAFIEPVFSLQDALVCSANAVTNDLGDTIRELLRSVLDNVENFVTCVGTQFVGSLLNTIISKILETITPGVESVSELLGEGMDIFGALTSGIDAITRIGSNQDCNQDDSKCKGVFTEYVIGKGVGGTEDQEALVGSILDNARLSAEIGRIGNDIFGQDSSGSVGLTTGGSTGIAPCDTSIPSFFPAPEIRIFGGGVGVTTDGERQATGTAVLGGFVRNVPKEGQSAQDATITASIIGVKLNDRGEGYKYPPFVEIIDKSKKGYGAVARAIIETNRSSPDYGKIKEIYMVSIGENYPIGDTRIDSRRVPIVGPGGVVIDPNNLRYDPTTPTYRRPRTITVGIGSALNVGIASLTVVKPGTGYTGGILVDPFDIPVLTGFGETIGIKTDSSGGVIGFVSDSPIAIVSDDYPEIRIRSQTGFGAEIKPAIGIVTSVSKSKLTQVIEQVIDCIS